MWRRPGAGLLGWVFEAVDDRIDQAIERLRSLGLGLIILRLGLAFWSAALSFFLIAVFFRLAELPYAYAAFVTGAISLIVGIFITLGAWRLLKSNH